MISIHLFLNDKLLTKECLLFFIIIKFQSAKQSSSRHFTLSDISSENFLTVVKVAAAVVAEPVSDCFNPKATFLQAGRGGGKHKGRKLEKGIERNV